jgi:nucleotide-binding universal stress UspA family protein
MGAEWLHIVHVTEAFPAWALAPMGVTEESPEIDRDAALKLAHRRMEALRFAPTRAQVSREVRTGPPAKALVEAAREIGASLIVVATRKRSAPARTLLGSVANALLRSAACPVMVVGEGRAHVDAFSCVLAAIDLSPISSSVLAHGAEVASAEHGGLAVVSVVDRSDRIAETTAALERFTAEVRAPGLEIERCVERGRSPKDAILSVAERIGAQLIVVGTSGHGAIARVVLGVTATHVIAEAATPVLAIPNAVASAAKHEESRSS